VKVFCSIQRIFTEEHRKRGKFMALPLLTISELTRYIKNHIDSDRNLQNLWVKGEISNFKRHSSGHMYFTLKDAESMLQCVMFRGRSVSLRFEPSHGMQVLAGGYVSVYDRDGRYQMYVENLQPDGIGSLSLAYEQLKEKLSQEGLFDEQWKKPIPLLPRSVGIVTSPTGAAIRDIVSVSKRRFPGIQLILYPVLVQGDQAPEQIGNAIRQLNGYPDIDVLIVGRGGGSLEELWAFNDERVVRAIFASEIPVISAIGHETDFTLADFVADRRAPTPSAAAEMAVPDRRELERYLRSLRTRLTQSAQKYVMRKRLRLENLVQRPVFQRPKTQLIQQYQYVDMLQKRLTRSFHTIVNSKGQQFTKMAEKLAAMNPLAVLQRGYSITRFPDDKSIVRSIATIKPNQKIEVILPDGSLFCIVEAVQKEDIGNVR
jgi:exodeoxyribonuclease VII large subunit